MAKYKVIVNKEKCIGCGACVSMSNNFKIVNGKSKAKKAQIDEKELSSNQNAANVCPVHAINIEKIE